MSSVPRQGKRAKETSLRTNEVAINFLSAIARVLRELSTQAWLYALVTRFPINDLLGRSSYIIGETLIRSNPIAIVIDFARHDDLSDPKSEAN